MSFGYLDTQYYIGISLERQTYTCGNKNIQALFKAEFDFRKQPFLQPKYQINIGTCRIFVWLNIYAKSWHDFTLKAQYAPKRVAV